jgi:hypothetical protein
LTSKPPSIISLNSNKGLLDGDTDNVGAMNPEVELSKYPFWMFLPITQPFHSECLKWTWHLPIYSFFKSDDISILYHNGWPCHFFSCAAWKCKTMAGGVRCFQDSKDWASTANLQHHALHCFGEEAMHNGTRGADINGTNGSIFSLFVC